MRTFARTATTVVALAAVFPFGMTSASADTLSEAPSASAYFSSTTPPKADAMPADPGPYFVGLNTDRVAQDNLAVAVAAPDRSDKESFLRFDLPTLSLDPTATISSAIVTVPLQADDDVNKSVSPDPAKVKACAAGPEGYADGLDAGAYDEKPTFDCKALEAVAQATPDGKAYTFDVTALASTWLTDINEGIALVPAVLTNPFQVVFRPAREASIVVTYTPTVTITDPDPVPTVPVAPPVIQPDVVAPPVDTGTAVAPPVVAAPQPTPAPSPAPRPAVAPRPIANTAAGGGLMEDNGFGAGFWLAALVGVALIGAVSLVLGSPEVPVRAGGVQNGVGRALDERRRVAGRVGVRPRPIPSA